MTFNKKLDSLFLLQNEIRLSKSGILHPNNMVTRRTVMVAILQTLGPVSTCQAIRGNWNFLRSATSKQFEAAGAELETRGFGRLISLSGRQASQKIFVKKSPEEAQHALEASPELCRADIYSARFNRPTTKKLNLKMRAQLAAMGLVSEKQLL